MVSSVSQPVEQDPPHILNRGRKGHAIKTGRSAEISENFIAHHAKIGTRPSGGQCPWGVDELVGVMYRTLEKSPDRASVAKSVRNHLRGVVPPQGKYLEAYAEVFFGTDAARRDERYNFLRSYSYVESSRSGSSSQLRFPIPDRNRLKEYEGAWQVYYVSPDDPQKVRCASLTIFERNREARCAFKNARTPKERLGSIYFKRNLILFLIEYDDAVNPGESLMVWLLKGRENGLFGPVLYTDRELDPQKSDIYLTRRVEEGQPIERDILKAELHRRDEEAYRYLFPPRTAAHRNAL